MSEKDDNKEKRKSLEDMLKEMAEDAFTLFRALEDTDVFPAEPPVDVISIDIITQKKRPPVVKKGYELVEEDGRYRLQMEVPRDGKWHIGYRPGTDRLKIIVDGELYLEIPVDKGIDMKRSRITYKNRILSAEMPIIKD